MDRFSSHLRRINGIRAICNVFAFCYTSCRGLRNVSCDLAVGYNIVILTRIRPWALACWAPFTFIGVEINKLGSNLPISRRGSHQHQRVRDDAMEMSSDSRNVDKERLDDSATGELAGIYLGILNLYTTLPQFIATGISMLVFTVLEPGKSPELAKDAHPDEHHGTEGYNGIAVCLFIGALCSVAAAVATQRFKKHT